MTPTAVLRRGRTILLAASLLLMAPSVTMAQSEQPSTESRQTAASPLARFSIRASVFSATGAQGLPAEEQKKTPIFSMKDHPTLTFGIVEIAMRARFQVFSQKSDAGTGDLDEATADIARKRIGVSGNIGNYADFQIEREVASDIDPWRDVYVNYSQFEQVQFQIGKFKQPFGLEENTSATNLDFAYRSLLATTIAPGRERGYMVHGRVLDRTVRYELGRFEHDGRNARPKRPTERVFGGDTTAGRVSAVPFRTLKSPADDFEIGVAWTSSEIEEGFSAIRGKTILDQNFFSNDYLVSGRRKRIGFETRFQPGPVSIQAEYNRVTDERLGESVEDTDLSPLRGRGWYVSGTWAVTGDKKADGLDATKRPIFRGGIGAVELAVRVERLTFDSLAEPNGSDPSDSPRADVILGNSNKAVTFGVNWYLNRWVKIQFNLIRETLTDPEQGPLPLEQSFSSRVLKFQFTL